MIKGDSFNKQNKKLEAVVEQLCKKIQTLFRAVRENEDFRQIQYACFALSTIINNDRLTLKFKDCYEDYWKEVVQSDQGQ